jgi:DNA-directed RNA polymerase subunit RPC12/RpoP
MAHIEEPKNRFINSIIASSWMIGVGIILCFTGIGAILGIPLILWAFIMPFIKPTRNLVGSCPYCGHGIVANENDVGVTCLACQQRIIIRNGNFHKLH